MTAPTDLSLDYKLHPEHDESLDLDTRVKLVEQRLVARELRCRQHLDDMTGSVGQALRPRRLVMPVLGAVAGGATLLWLLRGRRNGSRSERAFDRQMAAQGRHRAGKGRPGRASSGARGPVELPWVRLLGLAWPLLPARLSKGTNPAVASTLLALGLPVVERLLVKSQTAAPLPTAAGFDPSQLAGEWHVLARLPASEAAADAARAVARAIAAAAPGKQQEPARDHADSEDPAREAGEPADSGPMVPVRVRYTSGQHGTLSVTQRLMSTDGRSETVEGILRPAPAPVYEDDEAAADGRFQMSLWPALLRWLPGAWTEHWVLHFSDDASQALIGSPDRRSLWLLSRSLPANPVVFARILQEARALGFSVKDLRLPEQR